MQLNVYTPGSRTWQFIPATTPFVLTRPSVSLVNFLSATSYSVCQAQIIYFSQHRILNDCDGWFKLTLFDGSPLPSNIVFSNSSFLLTLNPFGQVGITVLRLTKVYTADGSSDFKEIEILGLDQGCLKLKNTGDLQTINVPLNSGFQY